jgi:5-deoxy-glucuronate isomerase
MVFRKTNVHLGRYISISPSNSSMKHLAYGRIRLNSATPRESFSNDGRETGLICLSGAAVITVAHNHSENQIELGAWDSIYIPRDSSICVSTRNTADLAEFSADVANAYPVQVVRNADLARDPKLQYTVGSPGCSRHIRMSLGKNVQAGRLLSGITQADPGNWTSWPPHEHSAMLEEIYVYFDMPPPAYGVQLVYANVDEPEFVTVVRDGDAVLIPKGFHPNVSVPGHRISFLWAMAAHRETVDRQYGVVNVQPGFA